MSRIFDPAVPEDLEMLKLLVAIDNDVRLEGTVKQEEEIWVLRTNYTLFRDRPSFTPFNEHNFYRVAEAKDEQDI